MAYNSDFYLPKGLPLEATTPEWLWEIYPFKNLDSSMGSLITMILIGVALAIASFGLSLLAKAFLPRVLKFIGKAFFVLLSLSLVAGVVTGVMAWNAENNISDETLGKQVTRTSEWMKTQNVNADNRTIWDLVCFKYDNKNENCRDGAHATVTYKGQKKKVRLETQDDNSVILWDYEKSMPLIVE